MSKQNDIPEIEHQVFRIEITKVQAGMVWFDMRIRGDKNWMYFDNVVMQDGQNMVVSDGQNDEFAPPGVEQVLIPRGETLDEMVGKHG